MLPKQPHIPDEVTAGLGTVGIRMPAHPIARQLIESPYGNGPDVLMGGGAEYFLPAKAGGKRKDAVDVIAAFAGKGWQVARDTAALNAASAARVLGLFSHEDLDLELDREKNQYETGQRGGSTQEQRQKDVDEALQKLSELARRSDAEDQRRADRAGDPRCRADRAPDPGVGARAVGADR